MWSQLGSIVHKESDSVVSATTAGLLDLEPFRLDNMALRKQRPDDEEVKTAMTGGIQADDCGKYTWLLTHNGLDRDEETWVRRLYY